METEDWNKLIKLCVQEQIHIPQQIQPHGFLISFDTNEWKIRHVSENITQHLEYQLHEVIGLSLLKLVGPIQFRFLSNIIALNTYDTINPVNITFVKYRTEIKVSYNAILKPSSINLFILEFEITEGERFFKISYLNKLFDETISRFQSAKDLQTLSEHAAVQVRRLIGFDRVMVYKFDENNNGEVIAESAQKHLVQYLGLRFPESDIPAQARELYLKNWTRIIPDASYTPIKIYADNSIYTQTSLDLTYSTLRSVSKYHIEYLYNMGVRASLSISIIYENKLWGLISCHNYSPSFITYQLRNTCEFIGRIFSYYVKSNKEKDRNISFIFFERIKSRLFSQIYKLSSFPRSFIESSVNLLSLKISSGASVIHKGKVYSTGITPSEEFIFQIINDFPSFSNDNVFYSHKFPEVYPPAMAQKEFCSGILILCISKKLKEYILFFRQEVVATVNWGGNPYERRTKEEHGFKRLTPRNSFEVWKENVYATSEQWREAEIELAYKIRDEILLVLSDINSKSSTIEKQNSLEFIREINNEVQFKYDQLFEKYHSLELKQVNLNKALNVLSDTNRIRTSFLTATINEISKKFLDIDRAVSIIKSLSSIEYIQDTTSLISDSLEDLNSYLKNILDFSNIEFGEVELNIKVIKLSDVIESAVEFFSKNNKNHNIIFNCSEKDKYIVAIDKERFAKSLLYLFDYLMGTNPKENELIITIEQDFNSVYYNIVIHFNGEVYDLEISKTKMLFPTIVEPFPFDTQNFLNGLRLTNCHKWINLHGGVLRIEEIDDQKKLIKISIPSQIRSENFTVVS